MTTLFPQKIEIGSKKFTESVIIGEIIQQYLSSQNILSTHQKQLGGTRVLWNAIRKGDIDIYPDYTGTLQYEIFAGENVNELSNLRDRVQQEGLDITGSLGFENNYAIGMLEEKAEKLGIEKISDLQDHHELKFGFTNEFMDRADGWPSLRSAYSLHHENVYGIDHDLAYRGLESGSIDVVDLYTTDAEIEYYNIKVLEDDLNHFPQYKAVIVYNSDLDKNIVNAIKQLEGSISVETMRQMNKDVKIDGSSETETAASFLKQKFDVSTEFKTISFTSRLIKNTIDHIVLVGVSLFAAIIIAIPLGTIAFKQKKFGQIVLGGVGILQTIPSLALLVVMIPLFGIGFQPAAFALFLYSLLPIVRNTYLGFEDIDKSIRESAQVLGLTNNSILYKIELPLASRSILSGIKTSAVINVGTATLGALIGAGGYGQPILTGIRLDDTGLILEGAVPAALLALFVQGLFDLSEKIFVPKGLRI